MGRRKKNTRKKVRKASPKKAQVFISKAPPPIKPVGGGGWVPPRPKRTQMPIDLPPHYPNDLKQLTRKIIAEAIKEFPEYTQITIQTQITKLCKRVVSKLTPQLCAAVEDEALSVMDELLHYLRVANCDDASERERIKQETVESDEWSKLVEEMAGVPSAALNDSSDTHLQKPKQRGRRPTAKRLIYERAATYKDSHRKISWGQLAKMFQAEDYSDNPKLCSDRVRMGVRRVEKAKRS